jgi:polysaccharide deacetylase family protein (PEP-CTERM system associated)
MVNAFTVDVEDYFHPSEVGAGISPDCWSSLASRVEIGTSFVLELLASHNVRGTFFILGWVAAHKPALVRRIAEAGHEVACHSYQHRLIYELSPTQFKTDTLAAVHAIEDACGVTPRAYRAPSFSITEKSLWAIDVLAECGFTHDSSICPIVHDRYGIPGTPRDAYVIQTRSGPITEVPVATVRLSDTRIAPVGGGAYLRLFPYRYTAAGLRRINQQEGKPACVYVHPWEVDAEQPRLAKGRIAWLRTYMGIRSMGRKLDRLLQEFAFAAMTDVYPAPAAAGHSGLSGIAYRQRMAMSA